MWKSFLRPPRVTSSLLRAITTPGIPQEPELDLAYLLDPTNKEEIEVNVKGRKGMGDINKVHDLHQRGLTSEVIAEAARLPNRTHPEVPKEAIVIRQRALPWRPKEELSSKGARSFEEITTLSRTIRRDNLTHYSSEKSYYLRDDLADLEQALVDYALDTLTSDDLGFELVSVPDILPVEAIKSGGLAVGDKEMTQVFRLDEGEESDRCLSGTSEMALAAMHAGHVLASVKPDSPLKLTASSRCYRAESSRKATEKGIYRVHSFTKVEMFALTAPQDSDQMLENFLAVQERLYSSLDLSYRVLAMPAHELGAPASRKYDVEASLPGRLGGGQEFFGEISSCSNCTDYQTRRLNIKDSCGQYVHTVNGTAVAVPRLIMALCEQHQTPKGYVALPLPLRPYMGGKDRLESRPKRSKLHLTFIRSPAALANRIAKEKKEKEEAKNDAIKMNSSN